MEKKYLSDCIRYTTDIAPYPFIQIYSGVGSGKNTFVDALAKGYEESQPDGRMETLEPKRVLCITSRRAKVDELKNAEDVAYGTQVLEYESLDYVEDLDSYFASKRELSCNGIWGTIPIYQRSIACTNAAIERYLEKHYRADKAEDFLWNRFDIIVVDEAHAVVADASYQTALLRPFADKPNAQNERCRKNELQSHCHDRLAANTGRLSAAEKRPRD